MLILLSPAKTLNLTDPVRPDPSRAPQLADHAAVLLGHLVTFSPTQLGALMKTSEKIAEQVWQWCQDAHQEPAAARRFVAGWTYHGPTFTGLAADQWTPIQVERADNRLRVLSGLYGVVRPQDLIAPYRLELGLRLAGPWGKNLYEFWADHITTVLTQQQTASGCGPVVNLASTEYTKAIQLPQLGGQVFTPVFQDQGPKGDYKIISAFAKKARGLMASWLLTQADDCPPQWADFTAEGYRLWAAGSSENRPVFRRAAV